LLVEENSMREWDPQQYLQFKQERTQPSIDLVARIPLDDPGTIIDIGCGPGNSTQTLRKRWPRADIVGIDKSEKMIERARADYPDQRWIVGDASRLGADRTYDIVFSNAAIQWIPEHDRLLPRLFGLVNKNGVLAVQVPANHEAPLYKILVRVSSSSTWSTYTAGCEKLITYHSAGYYYDKLVTLTREISLWETTYYHLLKSHQELIEWYRSTGMKPFLDRLPADNKRTQFEQEVLSECREFYSPQIDGKILYPFKRLFFTARKSANA
jgi:trans-aconitate 2-methyltransferase